MAYLKLGNWDVSQLVSGLKVSTAANYNARTNAAGNTVVELINTKRTIEATFIPITYEPYIRQLKGLISNLTLNITYRNPETGADETVNVMIPTNEIEYMTIQDSKVIYKPFTLTFIEL